MNWIEQTITEFGNSIGMPALAFDATLSLRLKMQDERCIFISHLPLLAIPEVLVGRSTAMRYRSPENLRSALRLVDFRNPASWTLQAAASDQEFILLMRIPERAFVLSVLEKALVSLSELEKKIES